MQIGFSASRPLGAVVAPDSLSALPVTTAASFGEILSALAQGISSAAILAGERPLHHPASEAGTPTKPTLSTASALAANHIVVFRMFSHSCGGSRAPVETANPSMPRPREE